MGTGWQGGSRAGRAAGAVPRAAVAARIRRFGRFALWLTVLGLGGTPPAFAEPPPGQIATLQARAASAGPLRLLVQIDLRSLPGSAAPAAVAARSAAIASAQQALARVFQRPGLRELHRYRFIPFVLAEADARGIATLGQVPEVVGLQQDIAEEPLLDQSAGIVGAPAVWGQGVEGLGQVIAVLDTGVDLAHPAFTAPGKLTAEGCFSTTDPGTTTSLCPGGVETSTAPGSGQACNPSIVGCGHGTHVAGIALGDDGVNPQVGVAPAAGLIAMQVFHRNDGSNQARSFPSDQIRALEQLYAWRDTYPIAAVNMSLGGPVVWDEAECDANNVARKAAIDNLRGAGIPVIVASGNGGSRERIYQPACISTAISVGSATKADVLAATTSVSVNLDLLAPGQSIVSAQQGGGFFTMSGTSMATPHVSGAWALLREAVPGAGLDDILQALKATGTLIDDDRTSPSGTVTDMPRINVDLALDLLQTDEPEFEATPPAGATLDWGWVGIGSQGLVMPIAIDNTGGAGLTLSCALTGANPDDFAVVACPAAVPALGSADLGVRCEPGVLGPLAATLEVTTNDADESLVSWNLVCEGVPDELFDDGFEPLP